jgi:hypothetical protein
MQRRKVGLQRKQRLTGRSKKVCLMAHGNFFFVTLIRVMSKKTNLACSVLVSF